MSDTPCGVLCGHLREVHLWPIAIVAEGKSVFDIALSTRAHQGIVVRCVQRPMAGDYAALATMLAEGDFDRAILVYCDHEPSLTSDEIESWPISRIDELAASLARESRP